MFHSHIVVFFASASLIAPTCNTYAEIYNNLMELSFLASLYRLTGKYTTSCVCTCDLFMHEANFNGT